MTTAALAFTPNELALRSDSVHLFWAAITDLRDLGAEHAALSERLARLEGQLADDTRGTPEQRCAAQERREAWRRRLASFEAEAHLSRLGIVSLWHRLPPTAKAEVRDRFGLEATTPAPVMAAGVWQRAKAGEAIPGLAPW